MEFLTIASGSEGNAALLRSGGTVLLIDAGISARRIRQALSEMQIAAPSAVLITHEHSDHIKGLKVLSAQCAAPVYASRGTAPLLPCPAPLCRAFSAGDSFSVGALTVRSFSTSHDAADSVGYRIDGPDGSFGLLTDTGFVPDAAAEVLRGVDILLLEANHDEEMLRTGPYPYPLKERILGPRGHLSNAAAAEFALCMARAGTGTVLLAHLSKENNTPAAAEYAVARRLQSEGQSVRLSVAPRSERSEEFVCRKSPSFA